MARTKLSIALTILPLLLAASAAPADIMTYVGLDQVSVVNFHGSGLLADGLSVYAGTYHVSYEGVQYDAFCVDADHFDGSGPVSERSVTTLHNGQKIAYIYETYVPQIHNAVDAAAVGVAIWELLYETQDSTYSAGSGRFYITGNDAVRNAANAVLQNLPETYQPTSTLTVLDSANCQDMLITSHSVSALSQDVPEPATMALILVAVPFVIRRYRRTRAARG
jgi:hypothetical protein